MLLKIGHSRIQIHIPHLEEQAARVRRRVATGRTRSRSQVGISGCIDKDTAENRLAPAFALDDKTGKLGPFSDYIDHPGLNQRLHTGILY